MAYVQFSREDFEQWLDSLKYKWKQKPNTAGIYLLRLSDTVAIEVSSSLTGGDAVMDHAQASMSVKLVSLVTGRTLNKVAQGQDHFKRTTNWQVNLKKGVERMEDAYVKSSGFYDALAEIEDREKYKKENLAKIEIDPNWSSSSFLSDLHKRLTENGILTVKQLAALDRIKPPAKQVEQNPEKLLNRVRALYVLARGRGNTQVMQFAEFVGKQLKAKHPLSSEDSEYLNDIMERAERDIDDYLDSHPGLSAQRVATQHLSPMPWKKDWLVKLQSVLTTKSKQDWSKISHPKLVKYLDWLFDDEDPSPDEAATDILLQGMSPKNFL